MQIAQDMSGFSLGQADLLRRAMGKKKVEVMAEMKVQFVAGAKERGIDEADSGKVFDLMAFFAGYGFNKSHSAAYGMVLYQTAFLKANYRAEYMAASMTIDCGNTEKVVQLIKDTQRSGIEILPPMSTTASGIPMSTLAEDIKFATDWVP